MSELKNIGNSLNYHFKTFPIFRLATTMDICVKGGIIAFPNNFTGNNTISDKFSNCCSGPRSPQQQTNSLRDTEKTKVQSKKKKILI